MEHFITFIVDEEGFAHQQHPYAKDRRYPGGIGLCTRGIVTAQWTGTERPSGFPMCSRCSKAPMPPRIGQWAKRQDGTLP
jgi:hypothetical protein